VTPLVPVRLVVAGVVRTIHLKLEGANPGGSLKDRTAAALVDDLEERGALGPGSILVESTSGNLGVALARLARARGYGFVAVVDPRTTPENVERMRRLGARVEQVDEPDGAGGYVLSRIERVRALCADNDRFAWPNQYENAANPRAHEQGTAREILRQMDGPVDALLAAVSTGGSLAGMARRFRRESPGTRIVAVDAAGSVALGGRPGPRLLTGIGASRRSAFLSESLYDELLRVTDVDAFACCHALLHGAGLSVGGSSGAVLAAASRWLAANPDAERVVAVCADRGERYARSIFDPRWLEHNGVRLSGAAHLEVLAWAG
jgi:N-(2-amino-2-carboxyethyl)-L-glutamate synthase